MFTAVRSSGISSQTVVELRHYLHGPTLIVECRKFLITNKNQVEVLQQTLSGWHSLETTAYCLANSKLNVTPYVQNCVNWSLKEACKRYRPVTIFFWLACSFRQVSILFVL